MDSIDTKQQLKSTVRDLIITQNNALKMNLREGTEILHSEHFPTQVFKLNDTKYIRINSKDIENLEEPEDLETLVELMLSIDDYSKDTDTTAPELNEVIEEGVKEYQSLTGDDLKESDLLNFDEFGNYVEDDKLPLTLKEFNVTKEEREDKGDSDTEESTKEDESITSSTEVLAQAMGMYNESDEEEPPTSQVMETQEVEQVLDKVEQVKCKSRFNAKRSALNKQQIKDLNHLTTKLLKAFRGVGGKSLSITPKKHISAKAMATDKERMYITKKEAIGKHIKMNLVIDMSGSMGGDPIRNAVSICYLFNKLAKKGFVTGNIIYSSTSEHYLLPMPAKDEEVLAMNRVSSSEGLARTVSHYQDVLKNTNLICITDGNIVDEPLKKEFWYKNKIMSTGVYVNDEVEDPLAYSGKMNRWFTHSLVRPSLEELIQLLIRIGLKG